MRVDSDSRVTPAGNLFAGEVDEAKIWNNALTVQEVENTFKGTFRSIRQVLYLDFSFGALSKFNYDFLSNISILNSVHIPLKNNVQA